MWRVKATPKDLLFFTKVMTMQKITAPSVGKRVRLGRILRDGKAVIFAYDHGFEHGPSEFPGERVSPRAMVKLAVEAGFDAIMTTKGVAEETWDLWAHRVPLILKITGKTSLRPPDLQLFQYQIGTVMDAVAMGADGVAGTVYWGAPEEEAMVERFAEMVAECDNLGMPTMILAYPRGPAITDRNDAEVVAYATRASAELGVDLVKTHYTGSADSFRKVVGVSSVPILMSGGPRTGDDLSFLRDAKGVMDAGGAGVVVGRNVFQSPNFAAMAKAIIAVVHGGAEPEEALKAEFGAAGQE